MTHPIDFPGHLRYRIDAIGDTVLLRTYRNDGGSTEEAVRALAADGQLLRTLPLPPTIYIDPAFVLSGSYGALRNFARMQVVEWSPTSGLLLGRNASYEFAIQKDTALLVVVAHEPDRLHVEERNWWRTQASNMPAGRGEKYSIPIFKPAYRDLRWDAAGRVWVWRCRPAVRRDQTGTPFPSDAMPFVEVPVYDVFRSDGEFLGRVSLPHRSRLLFAGLDRALIAWRKSNQMETVGVMQLDAVSTRTPRTPRRAP